MCMRHLLWIRASSGVFRTEVVGAPRGGSGDARVTTRNTSSWAAPAPRKTEVERQSNIVFSDGTMFFSTGQIDRPVHAQIRFSTVITSRNRGFDYQVRPAWGTTPARRLAGCDSTVRARAHRRDRRCDRPAQEL